MWHFRRSSAKIFIRRCSTSQIPSCCSVPATYLHQLTRYKKPNAAHVLAARKSAKPRKRLCSPIHIHIHLQKMLHSNPIAACSRFTRAQNTSSRDIPQAEGKSMTGTRAALRSEESPTKRTTNSNLTHSTAPFTLAAS